MRQFLTPDIKKTCKIIFLFGFILISACTTQKNTFVTRTYHNTTTRFNILFNGRESFKGALLKIDDEYKDDYSEILPVFKYGDPEIAAQVSGDMDRTLKKGSKIITFHSITVKPKSKKGFTTPSDKEFYDQREFNKWMDENYLLIGKAHFYKHDFFLAIETFRYMITQFSNTETVFNAKLWLARSYIMVDEMKDAFAILEELENEKEFPEELNFDLQSSLADFYIRIKDYDKAVDYLERALDLARKKKHKIRYTYILAQLNEELGNADRATELYERVLKMNPPYDLIFNASINSAVSYEGGGEQSKIILESLEDMLDDIKNEEYKDQIYFAMGSVHQKNGQIEEAIKYYKLSTASTIDNLDQQAKTYLTLGDIFYERRDYLNAQVYYDSAVINLDEDFENFDLIAAKASSLNQLAGYIHTATLQDSLQRLALLSEAERLAVIDKIIANVVREEREAREREQQMMEEMLNAQLLGANTGQSMNQSSGTSWYFYNINAKSQGKAEFRMKWGNRKLEDNWRRQNKSESSLTDISNEETIQDTSEEALSNKSREYYLRDIPLTDSMLAESRKLHERALYEMGLIYRNELHDYDEAIDAFLTLTKKYPQSDMIVSSYYYLYDIYKTLENLLRAEFYKNLIIAEYPNSLHAKILMDPAYVEKVEQERNQANIFYNQTYELFNNQSYRQVINNASVASSSYPGHPVIHKFEYLKILSSARVDSSQNLRTLLTNYIQKYPDTELTEQAKLTIELMDRERPELLDEHLADVAEEIYFESKNEKHYVVFALSGSLKEVNQLVFNLINYNLDFFDNIELTVKAEDFAKDYKTVIIREFNNSSEAMNYLRRSTKNISVYKDVNQESVVPFVISQSNFKVLSNDKSVTKYIKYYNNHY